MTTPEKLERSYNTAIDNAQSYLDSAESIQKARPFKDNAAPLINDILTAAENIGKAYQLRAMLSVDYDISPANPADLAELRERLTAILYEEVTA